MLADSIANCMEYTLSGMKLEDAESVFLAAESI
jgi:hypothetical protein